ncbi:MAG: hypothetical protein PHU03_07340, partial [Syntrophales bacterium]|nr:hypothetical protein [Syntrophales bacterium]
MFSEFFFTLKERGVPVTPTSFLRLHRAMNQGLILSIDDFYSVARSILIKSERYFDMYDQVFCHHFRGADLDDLDEIELDEMTRSLLEDWLKNPKEVAAALGISEDQLNKMTPEEVVQYFLDRLKDQEGEHHGGSKWIGTGGRSPVGHSGFHPGGMRVGGQSRNKSAVKVAMDRRYRDYSQDGPLTQSQMGEALKRLRRMVPEGPRDVVNVDRTIYETMRNAGEIEIMFDRRLADRLKVILMIDNGGWSMDPYIYTVKTLFDYARSQFKDITTYYFHNTIYDEVWLDPPRRRKPESILDFAAKDPETRIIIVGDASMAHHELVSRGGGIYFGAKSRKTSIENLHFLADTFR